MKEFQDLYRELCPSTVIACGLNYNMMNGKIVNTTVDFLGNVMPYCIFPAEYLGK